ncbi:MAG: hypothetical protein J5955_03910 [Bacilli bacterium]|nr:hypothetical protein [Bacilli bacterium]
MFEFICMSLLGVTYIHASIEERKQERIRELKWKVFFYAVSHHLLYNDVVAKIQSHEISIEEIEEYAKENEYE